MQIKVNQKDLIVDPELLEKPDDLISFADNLSPDGIKRYWFIDVRLTDGNRLTGEIKEEYFQWKSAILKKLHELKFQKIFSFSELTTEDIFYLKRKYPKVDEYIKSWHEAVLADKARYFVKYGEKAKLLESFAAEMSEPNNKQAFKQFVCSQNQS